MHGMGIRRHLSHLSFVVGGLLCGSCSVCRTSTLLVAFSFRPRTKFFAAPLLARLHHIPAFCYCFT